MRKEASLLNFSLKTALSILFLSLSHICQADDGNSLAKDIATKYLLEVEKWGEDEFTVDIDRYEIIPLKGSVANSGDNVVIIRATHKDDLSSKTPGVGKSLCIYVDVVNNKVVSVLHYQ